MSSLADQLKNVPQVKPRLREWIIALNPEDRAAFDEAISNPHATTEGLVLVLRENGCAVTDATLRKYRGQHGTL